MTKTLALAIGLSGAVWFAAPAQAATHLDGMTAVPHTDQMSARRHHRHARVVVRTYEAPRYYGYYGPTYYERPYSRPAPLWFGVGGWW